MKKSSVFKAILIILILLGIIYALIPLFISEVDYVSEKELSRNLENAKNGDADAMWYLTKRYYLYFEEDSTLYWAKKAYDAGNKEVAKYFWYDLGLDNVNNQSPVHKGLFKDKDYFYRTWDMGAYNGAPLDMPYLEKWAKKGLPKAIEEFTAYSYNCSSNPPIGEEAWEILVIGAKNGVAELQYFIRQIYEHDGYPETIDWLYLTANNKKNCQDRSYSQRMLAKKYLNGDTILNIKPNVPLAMYWMNRIVNTSKEEIDVECAQYNYQQCVKNGYVAAKADNTPYNKNPSGKYIWDKNKKPHEPITDIDNYLDTIYNAAENQDLSDIDTIPMSENFIEEMDYWRRHEL